MKITNDSSPNTIKKVSFLRTLHYGKLEENYVEALESPFPDVGPSIFIPSVRLTVENVPKFIKAIEVATMIASGELEIS